MKYKSLLLLAVAGLLVFAFASPRAESPVPGNSPAQRRQFLDSLRTLTPEARHAAMIQWIRAGRAARQASHGQNPGTPHKLGNYTFGTITFADEFMPAPYAPDGYHEEPSVAFDEANGGYLVVWQNRNSAYNYDIYGARFKADGSLIDPTGFVIASGTTTQQAPSVAYGRDCYLVVWQDNSNDPDNGTYDIYGSRVSTADGPIGNPFPIYAEGEGEDKYDQTDPSVASDGTNYLVVWQNSDDYNIHGALVDVSGENPVVTQLTVPISSSAYCYAATVASDGSGYLVAWTDYGYRGDGDIYGNLVSGGGVVGESEIRITTDQSADPEYPSAGYDGTNYLVAWDEYRNVNCDVYGARVTSDGDPDVQDIEIALSEWDEWHASVAFDGTDYIVAWQDDHDYSNADVYGAQVSKEGDHGDAFPICTEATPQTKPAVACGPVENTVLVAYQSITGVVGEVDYGGADRIWARPGVLAMSGDVGTASIERPVGSFLMRSCVIPPMAVVENYGEDACSFAVKFTINPGNWSSTRIVPALDAEDTRDVEFAPFILKTGVFTADCKTLLADDDDGTNDEKGAVFQGCTFIHFSDLTDETLYTGPVGHWTLGSPQSPWSDPPMDAKAWGNRLSGYYADDENSSLTSPIFKAYQVNPAIAFQHNISTEDGEDGANLWYSTHWNTDNTWVDSVAPTYSGGFAYNDYVNSLGGDGWTGWYHDTSGWRQSVFTIPVAQNTQFKVRWHLKADGDANTSYGWLIDEVAGIGCDTVYHTPAPPAGPAIDTLKVWPNPAHGTALVRYTLRRACNVSIGLYDASGRLAARVPTSGFKKGQNTATLDATSLARGVYFVKVKGETDSQTTKVIIE